MFKNIRIEIFAFLCIVFLGGLSAIVQPILNIPDETVHFARAERVSEGKVFTDPSVQNFDTIKSVVEMQKSAEIPIIKSGLENKDVDYTVDYVNHVAASNLSFLYFPQALGIIIAKALNLNVIWLLWMARLCNLIFYSILMTIAMHIIPRLKYLLLFISILPMSIQQAASCSVDATINGVTILYISFFLYLYTKKTISKREVFIFLILSVIIILAKVTNICIAGLMILLPLDSKTKNQKAKNYLGKFVGIFAISIIAVWYYVYTMSFAPNLGQLQYITQMNIDGQEQINYIINNFLHWARIFVSVLLEQMYTSIVRLNTFGSLSYQYPILIVLMIFLYAKISFQEKGINLSKVEKCLITLMILGSYALTYLALYIGWTPVGSDSVDGIQGRYFIPLLFLLGIIVPSEKNNEDRSKHIIDVMLMLLMAASMIIVTSNHYYA